MTEQHFVEEPCEVKVSRTVLKTSRRGDLTAEFNVRLLRFGGPTAARSFAGDHFGEG